jgi:YVTN family beta-propeller protein
VIPNLLKGGSMNLSKVYSNLIKISGCVLLLCFSKAVAVPVDLYVANNKGSSVTIINSGTNKSLPPPNSPITVGAGPYGIAITNTSNGVYAYVTNFNDNSVSVINTTKYNLVTTIKSNETGTFNSPGGIAATPNGDYIYVTNNNANNVIIIDTKFNVVVGSTNVGNNPSGIAIANTPNGVYAYVANPEDNTVSVINTDTNMTTTTLSVMLSPSDVAITPDGKYAYVVSTQQETYVNVIDTSSNTIKSQIFVDEGGLKGIAITPDGKYAYVGSTNTSDSGLSIIDTSSNTVTSTRITIAEGNSGINSIAITPDGLWVYVTNAFNNNVSVVSTKTQKLENTIGDVNNKLFNFPAGIAFAPPPPVATLINTLQRHTNLRPQ